MVDAFFCCTKKRSADSHVFTLRELIKLMFTKATSDELFPDFEPHFSVELSRFNPLAIHTALSFETWALMHLVGSSLETSQRVATVLAASPLPDIVDQTYFTNKMLISLCFYSVSTALDSAKILEKAEKISKLMHQALLDNQVLQNFSVILMLCTVTRKLWSNSTCWED